MIDREDGVYGENGGLGFCSDDNAPWIRLRTQYELGFLVKDNSGKLTDTVIKDLDTKKLHDILNEAGEITISRVFLS